MQKHGGRNNICPVQGETHCLVCMGCKVLGAVRKEETGKPSRKGLKCPRVMDFVLEADGSHRGVHVPHSPASCRPHIESHGKAFLWVKQDRMSPKPEHLNPKWIFFLASLNYPGYLYLGPLSSIWPQRLSPWVMALLLASPQKPA